MIWSKFQSINDFILQNWGACVDTIFGMGQVSWDRPIGNRKVIVLLWKGVDENQSIKIVSMTGDDR